MSVGSECPWKVRDQSWAVILSSERTTVVYTLLQVGGRVQQVPLGARQDRPGSCQEWDHRTNTWV